MKYKFLMIIPVGTLMLLSACMPAEIKGEKPNGDQVTLSFYPGGTSLDDLVIIDGKNHFGKAQYQMDDPIGDIGFRFNTGERVQAECVLVGKDIIGQDECKQYEVYRSNWAQIPSGTKFARPSLY